MRELTIQLCHGTAALRIRTRVDLQHLRLWLALRDHQFVPFAKIRTLLPTCETVSDVDARKKILQSSGRCFNCLRKNHISRNCCSSSKCKKCQGRHHTSICDKGSQKKDRSGQTNAAALDPEAPNFTPATTTTSTLCSTQGRAILLQTARTVAFNPAKPSLSTDVRLLFDSGSQ